MRSLARARAPSLLSLSLSFLRMRFLARARARALSLFLSLCCAGASAVSRASSLLSIVRAVLVSVPHARARCALALALPDSRSARLLLPSSHEKHLTKARAHSRGRGRLARCAFVDLGHEAGHQDMHLLSLRRKVTRGYRRSRPFAPSCSAPHAPKTPPSPGTALYFEETSALPGLVPNARSSCRRPLSPQRNFHSSWTRRPRPARCRSPMPRASSSGPRAMWSRGLVRRQAGSKCSRRSTPNGMSTSGAADALHVLLRASL